MVMLRALHLFLAYCDVTPAPVISVTAAFVARRRRAGKQKWSVSHSAAGLFVDCGDVTPHPRHSLSVDNCLYVRSVAIGDKEESCKMVSLPIDGSDLIDSIGVKIPPLKTFDHPHSSRKIAHSTLTE